MHIMAINFFEERNLIINICKRKRIKTREQKYHRLESKTSMQQKCIPMNDKNHIRHIDIFLIFYTHSFMVLIVYENSTTLQQDVTSLMLQLFNIWILYCSFIAFPYSFLIAKHYSLFCVINIFCRNINFFTVKNQLILCKNIRSDISRVSLIALHTHVSINMVFYLISNTLIAKQEFFSIFLLVLITKILAH